MRVRRLLAGLLVLAAAPGCGVFGSEASSEDEAALEEGWQGLVTGLEEARDAVRDPWRFAPAPGGRELAEGYRYLLGHLARVIESETVQHPDLPYFQRYVRMLSKWTIDNPDTMYLVARIDGEGEYRIRGRLADTSEWKTGGREGAGPKAPRIVTFQTTTAVVGQTGELAEMAACRNQTLGYISQFDLQVEADGRFEILIASSRPEDHDGNFLPSRATLSCTGPDGKTHERERVAYAVNLRESFSDWKREEPMELDIVRVDAVGAARPPLRAADVAAKLEVIGERVGNQIRFWNQLHEFALEIRGDRNRDGRRALPLNDLNPPALPFTAGGTAGARQYYSAGIYNLSADDGLVVRVETPIEPHYLGFQLANFWGESLDQANYTSSRTGAQLPPASDGARYYVIAHRDPGVPGWIDTTGLMEGEISLRFVYRDDPKPEELARVSVTRTPLQDLALHLPADTPRVDAESRRAEVAERQAHIRKRWRQY